MKGAPFYYPTPGELLAGRPLITPGRLAVAGGEIRALQIVLRATDSVFPGYSVTVGGEGRNTVLVGRYDVLRASEWGDLFGDFPSGVNYDPCLFLSVFLRV